MTIDKNSAIVGLIIGLLLASLAWSVGTSDDSATQTELTTITAITPDGDAEATSNPEDGNPEDGNPEESEYVAVSDLPTITLDELPPEGLDTRALILSGGPYPFDRDDGVFQNREGFLPDRDMGYYHEYTVITPGSPDRGARRIVAGAEGEMYYTDDHYASFREIIQ